MKKVFAFILALALCVTLVACGESKEEALDKQLQGVWSSRDADNQLRLEFQNGRFELYLSIMGNRIDAGKGTYEIGDGVIYLKHDDGDTGETTYTKENGVLVLNPGNFKKD